MNRTSRAARFVTWFLSTDFYAHRQFGADSEMWLEDADRAQRCEDAAEAGADGSTHAEVIQDMRKAFAEFIRYGGPRNPWSAGYDRFTTAIDAYFDDLKTWHKGNGSLHQEIG